MRSSVWNNRKSGIGNQEIWDLESEQTRHLKAEIRNLRLDLGDLDPVSLPGFRVHDFDVFR